jgi:hypothetical protein
VLFTDWYAQPNRHTHTHKHTTGRSADATGRRAPSTQPVLPWSCGTLDGAMHTLSKVNSIKQQKEDEQRINGKKMNDE